MPNESLENLELLQSLKKFRNYLHMLADVQLGKFLQRRLDASDIVQETFIDASRDLSRFEGWSEQQLFNWIKSILLNNINRAIEFHVTAQKRSVQREVSLDRMRSMQQSSLAIEDLLVSQVNSPSESAHRHEVFLAVADALAELKRDHRQIIILRTMQGLGFGEVANIMKRSEGACRMLWVRAIDELRQRLARRDLF